MYVHDLIGRLMEMPEYREVFFEVKVGMPIGKVELTAVEDLGGRVVLR